MSFNWRLLLAPEEVLDYVVEHEVCHLEIMDHSPRFWALLESRVPDWREHARWLRRYGATLVSVGSRAMLRAVRLRRALPVARARSRCSSSPLPRPPPTVPASTRSTVSATCSTAR